MMLSRKHGHHHQLREFTAEEPSTLGTEYAGKTVFEILSRINIISFVSN